MTDTYDRALTTTLTPSAALSGLEFLRQAMAIEDTGGIGDLLGMHMTSVEEGVASFQLITHPALANSIGTVHGGIAATMLDSAMACAVLSTLGVGDWFTTVELKVNYIRSAHLRGETLTARGSTIHVGRTTATAEGQVHNDEGRLIAHATTTCLIRRARA